MDDLLSILPVDVSMEGCCDRNYDKWEREVANPVLAALGFTVLRWRMGEVDSFGPLSRVVTVSKGDEQREFVYG